MKVCFSVDDFSSCNHNLNLIKKLKERYPKFKISVFATPFETQFNENDPAAWTKSKEWLEAVKSYDWIEILPHGLLHKKLEWYTLNYEQAGKVLDAIEAMMEEYGIKNEKKIFKCPQWEISYDACQLLKDRGYTLCTNPSQNVPNTGIKQYTYNWSINEPMPELDLIKAHGHVQNTCGNGLSECFTNLMKLPQDTEWLFVSEAI